MTNIHFIIDHYIVRIRIKKRDTIMNFHYLISRDHSVKRVTLFVWCLQNKSERLRQQSCKSSEVCRSFVSAPVGAVGECVQCAGFPLPFRFRRPPETTKVASPWPIYLCGPFQSSVECLIQATLQVKWKYGRCQKSALWCRDRLDLIIFSSPLRLYCHGAVGVPWKGLATRQGRCHPGFSQAPRNGRVEVVVPGAREKVFSWVAAGSRGSKAKTAQEPVWTKPPTLKYFGGRTEVLSTLFIY